MTHVFYHVSIRSRKVNLIKKPTSWRIVRSFFLEIIRDTTHARMRSRRRDL